MTHGPGPTTVFDVWGCRGSRNLGSARSSIGSHTSCYSLVHGEDLILLDAGRGLMLLGEALFRYKRFAAVKRVRALVSHSHLDHWEGLRDVEWFWRRGNGLDVEIFGTSELITTVQAGYAHPAYVPLDILAEGTVAALRYSVIGDGEQRTFGNWAFETFPLNHHSGEGPTRRRLHAVGFKVTAPDGARIAYLCDHEPTADTLATERAALAGVQLAVYDAHFADRSQQAHGHGSQEHAAQMAREHPDTVILAGHHGAAANDERIRDGYGRHGDGVPNFRLAVERTSYFWDPARRAFDEGVPTG